MMQILLYLLKLALPPAPIAESDFSSDLRERKSQQHKKGKKKIYNMNESPARLDDQLECLMDKLAVWQLTTSIAESLSQPLTSQRPSGALDWAQTFCVDTVEPLCESVPASVPQA